MQGAEEEGRKVVTCVCMCVEVGSFWKSREPHVVLVWRVLHPTPLLYIIRTLALGFWRGRRV